MDISSNGQWWTKQSEDILRKQYPLHCAVRDGNVEEMLSLLKTDQHDLYEEDDFYGWTPTHWAAYFGKLACLRKLVSLTTSNVRSCRNLQNLVHVSSEGGHPRCLQWLMQTGADITCQDYLGETPIHKAARVGSMECVSLLISQGASLSMKNHSNQTPSMVAATGGFQECSSYIEKAMQLQQQNLYSLPTKTCVVENNNIQTSAFHESHCSNELNGHAYRNGHSEMNDMETEMDMTHVTPDCSAKPADDRLNGFNLAEVNGDVLGNPVGSHCPSDYRCSVGTKRGRDVSEDESFKRRRVHDKLHMCQDESANNNNVLSSYNAILAISVNPLPRCTIDSQTPQPGNQCMTVEAPVENADFRMFSSMVSHHIPQYESLDTSGPATEPRELSGPHCEHSVKCTLLSSHMI